MAIQLYELCGKDNRRFSPYCWRARMALKHKALEFETVAWNFTEKDRLAFSGQGKVPVLVDDEEVISDSWNIACYLEDTYPDRASLFGGDVGRGLARMINKWTDPALNAAIVRLVVADIADHVVPEDLEYFVTTREKRLGASLADLHEQRDGNRKPLDRALALLDATLAEQPFLSGEEPAYADYIVFSAFQWARVISDYQLLNKDQPTHAWRSRMLDLFDGYAAAEPGYPLD